MIDFTPLCEAIITLLAAIITMYVVPWLKERYSEEQLNKARTVVDIAVYAAEKAFGAGYGEEKFEYAEEILADYGIKLDTNKLHAMIDASIKKMEQAEPWMLEQEEEAPEGE